MPAPQAKFEFVATGDAAVNAQIESVVNKLVKMKMQAKETTESAAMGMEKARMSSHLLNEELGLHMPRAMMQVMAATPGLSKALSMAFSVTAAVGFVEIIGTLIDKMPELTNAMMGFGEEAQKAFEKLKTGNESIVRAIEDNEKQALTDTLLGLSGSGMDSAVRSQLEAKRAQLINQRAGLGRANGGIRNQTISQDMVDENGNVMGQMQVPKGLGDDELAALAANDAKAQELTAQITALDGAITSAGKHLTHDLGDEGKAALEKLAQEAHKARDALTKMLGGIDQSNRDPIAQAIATENQSETQKLAILKDALDHKVISILQYNLRERQIVSEHMSALKQITEDGWQKIVNAVPAGDGAIPQILFAGLDPFEGLRKSFTDTQKLISIGLEDEAAKEKVISDQAKATGEDQYSTEQKLQDIRGKSADQLQAMADKMEQIAHAMGDAGMIAEADKFEAKLQDLRVKTASWGTELKKSLTQDGENLFVGLASGAEGWAQAFQNAGQSILAELAKIIYQLYIVKLLQAAINGITGGGGGGGYPTPDYSTISFGGGRAGGGPVLPGMSYMVGENGPERLLMGSHGGMVIPNGGGGASSGGGKGVQVNIHNYGEPMEQQQTSRFDGEQYVVDVVIKNIQSNGPIRQALR